MSPTTLETPDSKFVKHLCMCNSTNMVDNLLERA